MVESRLTFAPSKIASSDGFSCLRINFAREEMRFHAAFFPMPGIASSCFSVTDLMFSPVSTPVIERAPCPVMMMFEVDSSGM